MDINVLNINLLLEMHNGTAVTLFGTIFVDRAKSCSTCLLICCIKQIANSIIKSCHSPDRDLWAHRNLEHVSEFSRIKST